MEIFYDAGFQLLPRRKGYSSSSKLIVFLIFLFILNSCKKHNCSTSQVKKWSVSSFSSIGESIITEIDTICAQGDSNTELPYLTLRTIEMDSIFSEMGDNVDLKRVLEIKNGYITILSKKTIVDSEGVKHTILCCLSPKEFDFYPFCYEKGIGIVYYVFRRNFYFLKEFKYPNGKTSNYDFMIKFLKNEKTTVKV